MPLSKSYGLARAWPMAPGLGHTPSKGGGVIVTQTIMRETLVMRENLRMTDRG